MEGKHSISPLEFRDQQTFSGPTYAARNERMSRDLNEGAVEGY